MKCPKCGFDNLEEATYCIKCGYRLDEKIPCPKCGEYISNDVETCPHCGKAIPHKSKSIIEKDNASTSYKEKIAFVFNRVATFITLFLFILFIGLSFSNISNIYARDIQYPDFYIYLIEQYFHFADYSPIEQTLMIIRTVIIGLDIAVTISFAAIGISKTVKAFKNRDLIHNAYKYIAICIATKIMTVTMLTATFDTTTMGVSSQYSSLMSLAIIHLSLCFAFDCFLHFKRGEISIFIARIILGLGLFAPMLIISAFQNPSFIGDQGFVYHFVDMLFTLTSGSYGTGFISTFVLTSISFLIAIAILSLTYSIIVYFVSAYFRGMDKFKKFRIGFYMLVIALSILATSYLFSSIVEFVLLQNYLGIGLTFVTAPITVFVYSVLLVGVAVTTFTIYNRARRRANLASKTTTVE